MLQRGRGREQILLLIGDISAAAAAPRRAVHPLALLRVPQAAAHGDALSQGEARTCE